MLSTYARENLNELINRDERLCVSLYLPRRQTPAGGKGDAIRLSNLLRQAEQKLESAGVSRQDADRMLDPPRALSQRSSFQRENAGGLVFLLDPDRSLSYRLPFRVPGIVEVGDQALIKPLLGPLADDCTFFVLALSQNAVSLYRGTRYSIEPVELAGMALNAAEALRFEQVEKEVGFRSASSGGGGRRSARYFGGAPGLDESKERLLQFCQQVDRGLQAILHAERSPLLLAGVEYLTSLYKQANTYPHLLDEAIAGSPDRESPGSLHERAWELVRPFALRERGQSVARFRAAGGLQRRTTELSEVLGAAFAGRVETLFLSLGAGNRGFFDPAAGEVRGFHPTSGIDEDLANFAAVCTLRTGGAAFAFEPDEMPASAPLAALLRY